MIDSSLEIQITYIPDNFKQNRERGVYLSWLATNLQGYTLSIVIQEGPRLKWKTLEYLTLLFEWTFRDLLHDYTTFEPYLECE